MIDKNRLQNVVEKSDGSFTGKCPACASTGGDEKGEHLIVYPDGRFGCVVHPHDKNHRSAIAVLAGDKGKGVRVAYKVDVAPLQVPPSQRLLVVGRLGQKKATAPVAAPPEEPTSN